MTKSNKRVSVKYNRINVAYIKFKRKLINSKDAYIKIIKPNEELGGPFDFDKARIKKNIKMGYLDTMKSFNKLQGHYYYFDTKDFEGFLDLFNLRTIYGLELAAKLYGIELYKVYSYSEFIAKLYTTHKEYEEEYQKMKKSVGDIFAYMKSSKNKVDILKRGLGLCFFMDMITSQPKYSKMGIVDKYFADYKDAGAAMVELLDYMKE